MARFRFVIDGRSYGTKTRNLSGPVPNHALWARSRAFKPFAACRKQAHQGAGNRIRRAAVHLYGPPPAQDPRGRAAGAICSVTALQRRKAGAKAARKAANTAAHGGHKIHWRLHSAFRDPPVSFPAGPHAAVSGGQYRPLAGRAGSGGIGFCDFGGHLR